MKLIDANGSYTINANDNTGYSLCFGGGIISCMDESGRIICEFDAEDAPTVDAVPVVRCKGCGYHRDCDGISTGEVICKRFNTFRDPNFYCAYGERMANNGT